MRGRQQGAGHRDDRIGGEVKERVHPTHQRERTSLQQEEPRACPRLPIPGPGQVVTDPDRERRQPTRMLREEAQGRRHPHAWHRVFRVEPGVVHLEEPRARRQPCDHLCEDGRVGRVEAERQEPAEGRGPEELGEPRVVEHVRFVPDTRRQSQVSRASMRT